MATRKISELNEATSIANTDTLVIVQDGETKKVSASKLVKAGEQVASAETVGGYSPDDFVKKTEAASDSDKLGGVAADQYAKKSDITTTSGSNPFWWTPIPYILPDMGYKECGYVECDGSLYSREEYADLFAVLGTHYNLSTDTDTTKFRIPDLRGRSLIGHSVYQNTAQTNTIVPTEVGKYVQDTTNTEETITGYDEIPTKAYNGEMHVLSTSNVPMHRHTNGVQCQTEEGTVMPYGHTTDYDGSTAVTGSKVQTSSTDMNKVSMGYTGGAIYDTSNRCQVDTDTLPIGFNIVQPGLTVRWVMRLTKPA